MIFDRILCGIDASEESLVAARQAAQLVSPEGSLTLLAIVETEVAVHAGWAATALLDQLKTDAHEALAAARAEIADKENVKTRLIDGPLLPHMREAIDQEHATLVCVGTHGHGRAAGMIIGSLMTDLLHSAACSVLVARPSPLTTPFPGAIAVGLDGSDEAAGAAAAGAELAARFGVPVRHVVAGGGKKVDPDAVLAAHPGAELDPGKPVDVLVAASGSADLLVVGSRGLHGVRALGSVSERVAHEARCSVLVVRT